MIKLQTQFKVRVVYKSGYTHDFWCSKFSVTRGANYEWAQVSVNNKPVQLGVDDVAAVWQIGTRKRLVWGA